MEAHVARLRAVVLHQICQPETSIESIYKTQYLQLDPKIAKENVIGRLVIGHCLVEYKWCILHDDQLIAVDVQGNRNGSDSFQLATLRNSPSFVLSFGALIILDCV